MACLKLRFTLDQVEFCSRYGHFQDFDKFSQFDFKMEAKRGLAGGQGL